MVETDEKKYVRVMGTEMSGFVALEGAEGSSDNEEQYSNNEGELFIYQMSQALDGVKDILPKINFRRKHPELGKKMSNFEQRIRSIEKTIKNFKNLLAPHLINGMKKNAVDYIDKNKDCLIDDL